jgi:hypothetical protein
LTPLAKRVRKGKVPGGLPALPGGFWDVYRLAASMDAQ